MLQPGVYRSNVSSGCYWERLRNFSGTLDGILANDFVSSAGQQLVEVRSGGNRRGLRSTALQTRLERSNRHPVSLQLRRGARHGSNARCNSTILIQLRHQPGFEVTIYAISLGEREYTPLTVSNELRPSPNCPECDHSLAYLATYPPDSMFQGVSPENRRLRQVHSYRCFEHGLFHLRADGRLT